MKQQDFIPGWQRQKPDPRDFRLALAAPGKLPATVDLAPFTYPILNQGSLGSCTANAIATAMTFAKRKESKEFLPSRLFIYYNEREMINTVNEDSGAYIRDGFKSINSKGAPKESAWPYVIKNFTQRPPEAAYVQALANQSIKYYSLYPSVEEVKQALAAGFPVVFGFDVFRSFWKISKSKPTMPMPKAGEVLDGGHAVIAVGYSNRRKAFKIQNSWGEKWGAGGFFWMPYIYISDTEYTSDFWVLEITE
jgi:C1A family cysteine protease